MSNTHFVFIDKHMIPAREQLQKSIDNLGFDLKLDPQFTPFEDSGFSKCILAGEHDVGFEIDYVSSEEIYENDIEMKKISKGKNYCILMSWGSSASDFASAMIVSCALAKDFGAIVSYEGEEPTKFEELLSATNATLVEISQSRSGTVKFEDLFGNIIHNIDPSYQRNTLIRGHKRVEFLKEVEQGVFISQNVCKHNDRYNHCFCLTLYKQPVPFLYSPFTIGGRFSKDYRITSAISDYQGRIIMSDTHSLKRGWEAIAEKCSREAERILLPYYLSFFNEAREALYRFKNFIQETDFDTETTSLIRDSKNNVVNIDMIKFMVMYKQSENHEAFFQKVILSNPKLFKLLKENNLVKIVP